jgi:hypothetical protein
MVELASVGDFCPNPNCECYGDVEAKTIIRYGKTKEGRQRYHRFYGKQRVMPSKSKRYCSTIIKSVKYKLMGCGPMLGIKKWRRTSRVGRQG